MDLLPFKYVALIALPLIIFDIINILLLNYKRLKRKIKKFLSVIVVLVVLVLTIASFYIFRTLGVLMGNGDSKYKLENYSVVVLKDSKYKELSDIKNKKIGYYENSTGAKESQEHINKKVKVNYESYKSTDTLISDLLENKVDAILLEDSIKNIMSEEMGDFEKSIKVIYTFTIKVAVESTLKDVNVTKSSFAIYLSGIDTYGKISSVSRSDVNIVAIVNPNTKQILLISIPRDYYVQLHGTTGTKDKLTHAGIYGVDMSIKTIEDLLDTEINYYAKVNFTSVIDIVNALGNVDVYSEYTFVSYSGYSFKKGYNKVNGEQALDFARTRKAFTDGDRQRGKNQQALIEALIRKATDKSIITKYNSLLSAIDGKYQTNMSAKKITSLIKMQLNDMSPWNITSYSLTGSDSNNYTYTYNQLLYVMEPKEESVTEAKELIDKVLAGEKLEGSYGEYSGNSNSVNTVPIKKPSSSSKPKPSTNTNKPTTNPSEITNNNKPDENTNITIPGEDDNPEKPEEGNGEGENNENKPGGEEEKPDEGEKPSTGEEGGAGLTPDPIDPIIPSPEQ